MSTPLQLRLILPKSAAHDGEGVLVPGGERRYINRQWARHNAMPVPVFLDGIGTTPRLAQYLTMSEPANDAEHFAPLRAC